MAKTEEKTKPALVHVSVGTIVKATPDTPRGAARGDFGLNKSTRATKRRK